MDTKTIPNAVLWHNGMLLMPQHFQEADRRHEALLHHKLSSLQPFSWGVSEVSLDNGLLLQGIIRVLSLHGIMPDGQVIQYQYNKESSVSLELEVKPDEIDPEKPQGIWVTIPLHVEGSRVDEHNARFESISTLVRDVTTGEETNIPRIAPRVTLQLGERPPSRFVSMQIAELQLKDAKFQLAKYAPPSLLINDNNILFTLCSKVAEQLRNKATTLAERAASLSADETPILLDTRFNLLSLQSGLSTFEALVYSKAAHPLAVFSAMHFLAGGAASIGGTYQPPRVDYDHEDLAGCYTKLASFILRMLEAGIPETYETFRFELANNIFSINLEALPVTGSTYLIALFPRPGTNPAKSRAWMEHAVIGMGTGLEDLILHRSNGLKRKHVNQHQGVTPPAEAILYEVTVPAQGLDSHILRITSVIDTPEVEAPAAIHLYTVKKRKSSRKLSDDLLANGKDA